MQGHLDEGGGCASSICADATPVKTVMKYIYIQKGMAYSKWYSWKKMASNCSDSLILSGPSMAQHPKAEGQTWSFPKPCDRPKVIAFFCTCKNEAKWP
jgi:hypothetical protein